MSDPGIKADKEIEITDRKDELAKAKARRAKGRKAKNQWREDNPAKAKAASVGSYKKRNAKRSARTRLNRVEATNTNPSLRGLTHLSDSDLHLFAAACLLQPEVAPLSALGSKPCVYCFQSTVDDKKGWGASAAFDSKCEERESLSHLLSSKNPRLLYREREGGRRKITRADLFCAGSVVHIIRLVISPFLYDVTAVGFKGHGKEGGYLAEQR